MLYFVNTIKNNSNCKKFIYMKFTILHSTEKDSPLLSLSLLMIGILVLSLQDSLIKLFSSETSFWQIQSLRSFFNLILLYLISQFTIGRKELLPKNWKPVYLRGFIMTCCMFCFFSASPSLNISQMAAGLYTFPLFVTILAFFFSKEIIGVWRLTALLIGSIGGALVLEPWDHDFKLVQFLPILAGFFYACNIILIRKFCRDESPLSLTFAVGVMFFISGVFGIIFLEFLYDFNEIFFDMPFITIGWPKLTIYIFLFAIFCSILNVIGNLSLAKAYQNAESSWLAPLDYSYLLMACIWGKIIFDTWPNSINLIGILLISFGGVLIAYREHVKKVV